VKLSEAAIDIPDGSGGSDPQLLSQDQLSAQKQKSGPMKLSQIGAPRAPAKLSQITNPDNSLEDQITARKKQLEDQQKAAYQKEAEIQQQAQQKKAIEDDPKNWSSERIQKETPKPRTLQEAAQKDAAVSMRKEQEKEISDKILGKNQPQIGPPTPGSRPASPKEEEKARVESEASYLKKHPGEQDVFEAFQLGLVPYSTQGQEHIKVMEKAHPIAKSVGQMTGMALSMLATAPIEGVVQAQPTIRALRAVSSPALKEVARYGARAIPRAIHFAASGFTKSVLDNSMLLAQGGRSIAEAVKDIAQTTADMAVFALPQSLANPLARIPATGAEQYISSLMQGHDQISSLASGVLGVALGLLDRSNFSVEEKALAFRKTIGEIHQKIVEKTAAESEVLGKQATVIMGDSSRESLRSRIKNLADEGRIVKVDPEEIDKIIDQVLNVWGRELSVAKTQKRGPRLLDLPEMLGAQKPGYFTKGTLQQEASELAQKETPATSEAPAEKALPQDGEVAKTPIVEGKMDYERVISEEGGTFLGVTKGFKKKDGTTTADLIQFRAPSGTTLAIPSDKITPDLIRSKIADAEKLKKSQAKDEEVAKKEEKKPVKLSEVEKPQGVRAKHWTTAEGKAALERGEKFDFTKKPIHGTGSLGGEEKTGRFAGDRIYLSLADDIWGKTSTREGEDKIVEVGGVEHLKELNKAGAETFYDYDNQKWMAKTGAKVVKKNLHPVEYEIDAGAKIKVIDNLDSYRAAQNEVSQYAGDPGFWDALAKKYDAVVFKNVGKIAREHDHKFFKALLADQIVILNPDKVRVVSGQVEKSTPKPDYSVTSRTSEDFEINPSKMKDLKKGYVSIKFGKKVYAAKIGSVVNGVTIYNHADLAEAKKIDFHEAIPGFIDKKGKFVDQYPPAIEVKVRGPIKYNETKAAEQGDLRTLVKIYGGLDKTASIFKNFAPEEVRKLFPLFRKKGRAPDGLLKELKGQYPDLFKDYESDHEMLRALIDGKAAKVKPNIDKMIEEQEKKDGEIAEQAKLEGANEATLEEARRISERERQDEGDDSVGAGGAEAAALRDFQTGDIVYDHYNGKILSYLGKDPKTGNLVFRDRDGAQKKVVYKASEPGRNHFLSKQPKQLYFTFDGKKYRLETTSSILSSREEADKIEAETGKFGYSMEVKRENDDLMWDIVNQERVNPEGEKIGSGDLAFKGIEDAKAYLKKQKIDSSPVVVDTREPDEIPSGDLIETDASRIQELKNSIAEAEMIVKSGKTAAGRKMEKGEIDAVQRTIDKMKAKLPSYKKAEFGGPKTLKEQKTEATPLEQAAADEKQGSLFGNEKGSVNVAMIPGVEEVAAGLAEGSEAIIKTLAPMSASPEARIAAEVLREQTGKLAQATDRTEKALENAQKLFDRLGKNALPFIYDMEAGRPQPTPELQQIADIMRKMLDDERKNVQALGKGKLEHFIDNYFPHIWEDPKKAKDVIRKMFGKRPLQGSKSFLKERTIESIEAGIKKGLIPASYNPVDLVMTKLYEMRKYVMAHKVLQAYKAMGLAKFVAVGMKPPEGWVKVDDSISTVYGSPMIQIQEAFDKQIYSAYEKIMNDLGIDYKTKAKIGGKRWGYYRPFGDEIVRKFGGDLGMIGPHEIGHWIDEHYGLQAVMFGDKRLMSPMIAENMIKKAEREGRTSDALKMREQVTRNNEIRALADASGTAKYYRRKGTEKMAFMIETFQHAPDQFKQLAPETYKFLTNWMKFGPAADKLKPLFDIKPSIELGVGASEVYAGGLVISGYNYMPGDAARIINNYLSPGLRKNFFYNLYRNAGNSLNQFQLGLSAFHAGFTTIDVMISKMALGFNQMMDGKWADAFQSLVAIPANPISNIIRGDKLLKAWYGKPTDAKTAAIAEAMASAGGRARMDKFYLVEAHKQLKKNIAQGKLVNAFFSMVLSLVEKASMPIMNELVPRQKLGVFFDIMDYEIKKNPKLTHEELRRMAQKAWDSVDNRLGQLVYDNLFWDKTVKDLLMGSVRSLGWNLGTLREVGGGAIDFARMLNNIRQGKKPENSYRTGYLLALPILVGILGAIYQYLRTGQAPSELKDYYFPKNGKVDRNGDPQRVSLPTYMKDIYHYTKHPFRTVMNKLAPQNAMIFQMLENKDYYGTEIRNVDDPALKQLAQEGKFFLEQLLPFGIRQAGRTIETLSPMKAKEGKFPIEEVMKEPLSIAEPFVGVVPAPYDINMTKAEERAYEIMRGKIPMGARTEEQADRSKFKADLRNYYFTKKDSMPLSQATSKRMITSKEKENLMKSSKEDPLIRMMKSFTVREVTAVYKQATPEERKKIIPVLKKKLENKLKKPLAAEEEKQDQDLYKKYFGHRFYV